MHGPLVAVGMMLSVVAAAYAVMAALASLLAAARSQRASAPAAALPAVTVLKPLCGDEPGLYQRLCSTCVQDYPQFQIIFGLHGPADSALPVARRVQQQFPALDIQCVVDPTRHG